MTVRRNLMAAAVFAVTGLTGVAAGGAAYAAAGGGAADGTAGAKPVVCLKGDSPAAKAAIAGPSARKAAAEPESAGQADSKGKAGALSKDAEGGKDGKDGKDGKSGSQNAEIAAAARALGVSESRLNGALIAAKQWTGANPQSATPTAFLNQVAKELGLPVDQVRKALDDAGVFRTATVVPKTTTVDTAKADAVKAAIAQCGLDDVKSKQ